MKKRAVLIVGHGSTLKGFQRSMEQLARRLRDDRRFPIVHCAYLKNASPAILTAVDRCVQEGAGEVLVLPYFLSIGNHVKSDIPRLVALAKTKYRGIARIRLCPHMGYHEKILFVVKERLKAAH